MEKEFIPYEQALELKELGFDEPCFGVYINNKLTIEDDWFYATNQETFIESDNFTAPTFSQAFRWFREKGLRFCIIDDHSSNETPYSFTTDHEYYYDTGSGNNWYKTYEEAELACLKKLIEIVKK